MYITRFHALALGALLAGCAKSGDRATDSAATSAPASGAAAVAPATDSSATAAATGADTTKLSDANIMAKELGGDSAEVQLATLARDKATSAAVKAYASELVSDHGKGMKEGHQLAQKLAITPTPPPNDTTAQMTAHLMDRFTAMPKGASFDTAFVNHEIEDHHHDIDEAHTMASAAQRPEVKDEVQKSLPVLEKHLKRAEELQKSSAH